MFNRLIISYIKNISHFGLIRNCLFQKTYFSKSLYPTFDSFKAASDYLSNLKVTSGLPKKRRKKKCLNEINVELPIEYECETNNSALKSDFSSVNLENQTEIRKDESVEEIQNSVSKKPSKAKKNSTKEQKTLEELIKSMNLLCDSEEIDRVCVYTDGSCKNGKFAGIGVYWGSDCAWNVAEKFVGVQTNIRAEIAAATRAIEIAHNHGIKKVLIHTDSQFTINCMTKWLPGWKNNNWIVSTKKEVKCRDVLEKLDKLIIETKVDVKWKYVPAHKGDKYNNCADLLSKKGSDTWKISE